MRRLERRTRDTLVAALLREQGRRGWTDERMAAMLGISRSLWAKVSRGQARPRMRLLQGVSRAFPWLQGAVLLHLAGRDEPTDPEARAQEEERAS